MATGAVIPPPPKGYSLVNVPPPPAGYTLQGADAPAAAAPAPQDQGLFQRVKNFMLAPIGSHFDTYNQETQKLRDVQNSNDPNIGVIHRTIAGMEADGADTLNPLMLVTAALGGAAGAEVPYLSKGAAVLNRGTGAALGVNGLATAATHLPGALQGKPDDVQATLSGLGAASGGAAGVLNNKQFANQPIQNAPARLAADTTEYVKQKLLPGTPAQLLVTATKPTVGLPDYEASLNRQIPALAKDNPRNLKGLVDAADNLRNTRNAQYQSLLGATQSPVNGNAVANAQMDSIPPTNLFEDPSLVQRTQAVADKYRTLFDPADADAIRVDTNAKLRAFYNKQGGDQQAALSNPETARIHAINTEMRNQLYSNIKGNTGYDPAQIQQDYGDAVDIGDTAARRNTVFSRRQPEGLNELVNNPGHPIAWLAGKLAKTLNDNDVQTRWAFDRYNNQQLPQAPINGAYANYGALAAAIANAAKRR